MLYFESISDPSSDTWENFKKTILRNINKNEQKFQYLEFNLGAAKRRG